MTEVQATLHQLQLGSSEKSNPSEADSHFVQTVELGDTNPLRKWLRLSVLLAFVVGFLSHQYYLAHTIGNTNSELTVAQVTSPASVSPEFTEDVHINEAVQAGSASTLPVVLVNANEPIEPPLVLENHQVDDLQVERERELNLLKLKQLDLLYKNASIALSKDRLMTPESDNAVHYFQSMLDIESTEPRALAGLQRVAKRYKTFAIRLAKKGDISGAAEMLERAESVVPQLINLGDLIAEMPVTQSSTANSGNANSSTDVLANSISNVQGSGTVRRSIDGQAEDAKFLAKKYLAVGQARDAALLLASFMPQSATDGELVELLHQAYLNSNQSSEALNLRVTLQGALPNHHIAKMQAAEFIQSGRPIEAITVLEKNLPSYESDSVYYGLLAGLYYRVQRYADAEKAYEKLLAVAPKIGSYWLGYAVSLDAQSDEKALAAFKKASLTLPAQDAARQYVEQRVRELAAVN